MTMINDQACLLPIQPKRNPRSIIPPPSSFDLLFSRALGKVDSRCFYARGSQSETDPILISNLTAMQNRCSLETVTTFNFTFKRLVRRIGVGIGEGEIRQVSPISFLFLFILPSRWNVCLIICVALALLTKNRKVAEDNFLIYSIKRHCNEKSETFRTCAVLTIMGRPTIETENNGRKRFT